MERKYIEIPRCNQDILMVFEEMRTSCLNVDGKIPLDKLLRVAFLRTRRTFCLWSEAIARKLIEVDSVNGTNSDFYLVEDGKVILEKKLVIPDYSECMQ